jgi:hypothetical protein
VSGWSSAIGLMLPTTSSTPSGAAASALARGEDWVVPTAPGVLLAYLAVSSPRLSRTGVLGAAY